MSLSPIGSAVLELLSHKHTGRHTDIHTLNYFRLRICNKSMSIKNLYIVAGKVLSALFLTRWLTTLSNDLVEHPVKKVPAVTNK